MNDRSVGKLERVPLRNVWKHEAYEFTKWLQENIEVLSGVLDLNLTNIDREQAAGAFSIDLATWVRSLPTRSHSGRVPLYGSSQIHGQRTLPLSLG